jgi:hypothetical protein
MLPQKMKDVLQVEIRLIKQGSHRCKPMVAVASVEVVAGLGSRLPSGVSLVELSVD